MVNDYCPKHSLIILPPPPALPQKSIFSGGRRFFWIKSSIFEYGQDKNFWRDFGAERTLSETFRPIIGQHRPNTHNWIFKKLVRLFSLFWAKFRTFWVQDTISKIQHRCKLIPEQSQISPVRFVWLIIQPKKHKKWELQKYHLAKKNKER